MNKLVLLSGALLLSLSLSQAPLAQGRGNQGDKDRGPDKAAGRGADRAERGGGPQGKGQGRADRDGRPDRPVVREARREPGQGGGKGAGRGQDRDDRAIGRPAERAVVLAPRAPQTVVLRRDRDLGLIAGCPPGLAKRNNGCLPPGQERKIARARFDNLFGLRRDGFDYRYDDGYLYRFDRQGSLLGYLPALGGVLAVGNPWPVQYRYVPAPVYVTRYYRLNDPYDYRYADGAIYALDPQTQAIRQVVALLTGQPMTVGQRVPVGYDVYNVPYAYRDRYYDTPDRLYRYSDGYVYQIDPTTQLVQAVIQLLT